MRQSWRFEEDEPHLGDFKFGVGKLIAHCERSPLVVPIYHRGMDQIIPEKILKDKKTKKPSTPISAIPRAGKEIKLFVGESLDFTEKVTKRILNTKIIPICFPAQSGILELFGHISDSFCIKIHQILTRYT